MVLIAYSLAKKNSGKLEFKARKFAIKHIINSRVCHVFCVTGFM